MSAISRLLALALVAVLAATPVRAEILGGGSTLAFPILSRWSQAYQRALSDRETQVVGAGLDYELIGSQAGIMRLREAAVDFGATDVPLSEEELKRFGFGQFPFVVGGIVVAVNAGTGQMRLTGEVIADIYLGRITRWSDPAIKALNPDLKLPDAAIAVLRRSDGSGTTFGFTTFLAGSSPQWRNQVGAALGVAWPVGAGAKGNDGMAEALRQTPNAIGYLDFAQATRAGLSTALIRNEAGLFVRPGVDSFRAAAESAGLGASADVNAPLTGARNEAAYPIVAVTYAVLPRKPATTRGGRAAVEFFRWSLENGAPMATELGYVPLPAELVNRVKAYWAANF